MPELSVVDDVLDRCRAALSEWRDIPNDEFDCDDPKGFSSFTMGIRCRRDVDPPSVLYRGLAGKENAILDFDQERDVFLLLGDHRIAAHCHYYDSACRIEEFYEGRTLTPDDLEDSATLKGIAAELFRFHKLAPDGLPERGFFELLHEKWGSLGRAVLIERRHAFPPAEQLMCDDLLELYADSTAAMVQRCLPDGPMVFCHNDTYHGNVMKLADGRIKLLDFEFSSLNHPAYDFSNLFAETVMKHGLAESPHFRIADPEYTRGDIAKLVTHYVDFGPLEGTERSVEIERLIDETLSLILLSHYMYAMAAIPLSIEPIQRIRFIPYAHARWNKFQELYQARFA